MTQILEPTTARAGTRPAPPPTSPASPARRPPPPAPSGVRLSSLTGLRFIAAALVFVYHAALTPVFADAHLSTVIATVTGSAGFVGVAFFFVLSGFVLTWSQRGVDTARAFWARRLAKVYPSHLVVAGLVLALAAVSGTAVAGLPTLGNLLLLQAWVPDYTWTASVNGVSWSLSCEVFFYLLFPLLLPLVSRVRPARLWAWTVGLAAVVMLLPVIARVALPSSPAWPWGDASYLQIWFVYAFPVTRLLEFLLGVFTAKLVLAGRFPAVPRSVALLVFAGAYALSRTVPILWVFAAVTVVPTVMVIGAFSTAAVRGRPSVLGSRVWVRLGEVSFAFYLVHAVVLGWGQGLLGHHASGWGAGTWSVAGGTAYLVGAFAVSLALAWALHVGVELPVVRVVGARLRAARAARDARAVPPATPTATTTTATTTTATATATAPARTWWEGLAALGSPLVPPPSSLLDCDER